MKFTYLIFMFFCGVAFTLNCSLFTRNGTNIPIKRVDSVKFCDLVNNPDKYDNQSVSTVAVLLTGFERAFLYDPMCISEKTLVWYVIISPSEIEKMN